MPFLNNKPVYKRQDDKIYVIFWNNFLNEPQKEWQDPGSPATAFALIDLCPSSVVPCVGQSLLS
jgi:hypothetical protein